ncbi:hypothetical protein Gotri_022883 [Gossypium trilobum]|uniref:Uncharacterized protein n=1 Tax=Gossypium trilobum TaxID=34281 RepID=A0A7J9DHR0_9ROSI|nr:hypothetical protein [Gossypium trilobum]
MIYCHNYNHVIPCLHCHPHSYIRMVSEISSNFLCYSRFQVEKNSTETCRITENWVYTFRNRVMKGRISTGSE